MLCLASIASAHSYSKHFVCKICCKDSISQCLETVFAHSDDLAIPILVEWLDIADVLHLDTACAISKCEKEHVRRLFALPHVVFHNAKRLSRYFERNTIGILNALMYRKMRLAKVLISSSTTEDLQLIEKYLTMCGPALRSLEFQFYDSNIMSTATEWCSNLKELLIYRGQYIPENSVLFLETIETFHFSIDKGIINNNISIKFPNLIDLTIVGSGVSDSVCIEVVQHTTKLRRLEFDCAHKLTEASYTAVGHYCKTLTHLSVCNMSFLVTHLTSILQSTPQLIELRLHRNHGNLIARGVFEAVAAHCPNRTELSLGEFDCAPESIMLTAFVQMLTRCVHLRTLGLFKCWFVTDDILLAVASNAKSITSLDLFDCNVSNGGLAQIAKHCRELQFISLCVGREYDATEACRLFFRHQTTVRITNFDTIFDMIYDGMSENSRFGDNTSEDNNDSDDSDASDSDHISESSEV